MKKQQFVVPTVICGTVGETDTMYMYWIITQFLTLINLNIFS